MSTKTTNKNDATTTNETKTFTLANASRDLGHNPKMVRSRFRRYIKNDDERYNVIRNRRCTNAKSRWVFFIDAYDAICEIIKRDDDE